MIIQHNIAALNSHRQLGINNSATSKNLEKLSSGYRINRAGDDAAGLAISEKMRGQIRGLAMAEQNVENGISLIQTAEGGLNETHAILQRMRELAVQSANGTYDNDVDRYNLNKEVTALKEEIDRISQATHYNGINLLDGSMGSVYGKDISGTKMDMGLNTVTGLDEDFGDTYSTTAADGTYSGTVQIMKFTDDQNNEVAYYRVNNQEWREITETYTDEHGTIFDFSSSVIGDLTGDGIVTFDYSYTIDSGGTDSNTIDWANAKFADANSQLIFQIGANGTADQRVGSHVDNMSSYYLGMWTKDATGKALQVEDKSIRHVNISTQDAANASIEIIDAAINQVSSTRSDLGALQNRLEHTLNNLGVTKENLTAAESTIRDVDMAKEMMEYTKNTILVQASQAMLAQAQQLPQGVLQLLN